MQSSDYHYDEVIDLRELVTALWSQRRVIASAMLIAFIVAAVANYVITPTYESSMVVSVPDSAMNGVIAASPQLFKELAMSNAVLTKIAQHERFTSESPHVLGKRIQVQLNEESPRLLTVTATGSTPDSAYHLLIAWSEAFETNMKGYFTEQLRQHLASAESIVQDRMFLYDQANKKLADFDRMHSISLVEQNVASVESDLTQAIASIRALTGHEIPSLEEEVSYWTDVLAAEDLYLDENGVLLMFDSEGTSTPKYLIVNPIHIQAKDALISARQKLLLARRQHDALSAQVATLEEEIQKQWDLLVSLKEERERLTRELARLEDLYTSAVAKRDAIKDAFDRVEQTIVQVVVSPPLMPETPVKPRKMLNLILALCLGAFVGVAIAIVRSWWDAPEIEGRTMRAATPQMPSQAHPA